MKDQRRLLCLALFALHLWSCHRPGAVLLFNGTGISPNDVAAIETLLEKNGISYSTASSAQLDEMSAERLRAYRLVIVPGLAVFAALGLVMFFNNLVSGKFWPALAYTALLIASTLFVSWPQRNPSLWALDAYNSGWQALQSENLPLAERKLELARAYVPDNAEINFALGNLKLAQNDSAAAQLFYRAVLDLDPKHKGAFNNLGVIALEASQFGEAERWFRHAENIDPRSAKTHFLLAKTLLKENDPAAAKAEIETALRLKPEQPEFNALKEEIESNRGD